MRLSRLDNKEIGIIGYGREGKAVLRALEKLAPGSRIKILDKNTQTSGEGYPVQLGEGYLDNLESFDYLIKSPGVPPDPRLIAVQEKLTNSTQIFLEEAEAAGSLVIGVTGSKGKSTVSSLIYELEKAAGREAYLVGNIGQPALAYLDQLSPQAVFVHELSSYQLMEVKSSPRVAVITSFFPEHLDYHGSLEAYYRAKSSITAYQKKEDAVFYNALYPQCEKMAALSPGQRVPFSAADAPLPLSATQLLGEHNLSNIAAAYKVGLYRDIPEERCLEVFRRFKPLPHRLQPLGVYHGIEWVDDAISTTPESTIAAIDALGGRVDSLILGGLDRGNDFTSLAERIIDSSINTIILFPGSGPRIGQALSQAGQRLAGESPTLFPVEDMAAAVKLAKERTKPGAICLLSTASPSYNMFRNYEEKGERFAALIKESGC